MFGHISVLQCPHYVAPWWILVWGTEKSSNPDLVHHQNSPPYHCTSIPSHPHHRAHVWLLPIYSSWCMVVLDTAQEASEDGSPDRVSVPRRYLSSGHLRRCPWDDHLYCTCREHHGWEETVPSVKPSAVLRGHGKKLRLHTNKVRSCYVG